MTAATEPGAAHDPFWLGRALAEAGAVSGEQLASAKRLWRKNPRESFAALLASLGLGEERQLAALVARHHGLPAAELTAGLDRAAARLISAAVARKKGVLPFRRALRVLDVAVADPAAYGQAEADRDFPDHEVRRHVAPRSDILALAEDAWRSPAPAATAGERFEDLVREAVAEGATDLHLEPRERSLEVRLRVDGRLVHHRFIEQDARESIIQAAKIAGRMDIAERRMPQDGQGALAVGSHHYHLRFSSLPAVNGEAVAIRLIDEQAGLRTFAEMGLAEDDAARVSEMLNRPTGLIYVTGPTGSGKTTLLYSMLNNLPAAELNALKIITLEEPVEVRHPRFFLQVGVDERIGRTFSELLRHVLRHDPDVILVGETRDLKTAEITLTAALTGHLCLSTLHTNDALAAVERLLDLGLDPLMISSALKGVIGQRLVRRPCPECCGPHPRADLFRRRFAVLGAEVAAAGFVAAASRPDCPGCLGRGYRGRIAIVEVFPLGGLERFVAQRARPEAFLEPLRRRGCRTLFEDGVRKAARGLTTMEEVYGAIEGSDHLLLSDLNP